MVVNRVFSAVQRKCLNYNFNVFFQMLLIHFLTFPVILPTLKIRPDLVFRAVATFLFCNLQRAHERSTSPVNSVTSIKTTAVNYEVMKESTWTRTTVQLCFKVSLKNNYLNMCHSSKNPGPRTCECVFKKSIFTPRITLNLSLQFSVVSCIKTAHDQSHSHEPDPRSVRKHKTVEVHEERHRARKIVLHF